ncbi:hypothetical protein SADUNF_Sadunf05G0167400 [Salix dunnii]|uniref:Major facilitator superfamily (MFS) profile domain-containing protein n=1 Tax=Salix dunnii TaxID=1413687 RepID=A0A835KBU2_9ROSI|nr:hypothetical protein SADUNF_Sadunf05G0167400 [Salix dunnii]
MAKELQVLNALDVAKTQWYHFTAIIIAGMGFFTDAYDLFCISLVTKLLGRIYYHVDGAEKPGSLPPNVAAAVNGVAFCGTLSGQLFFGWLGDKMGRKRVYGMTLMLMVICSIASGLSFSHDAKAVMSTLCFFRFWLGFGIGGDYPLSATIMSEYANKKTRGAFIAAVFAMQGFGILAGGIFAIIVSSAFKAKFDAPAYKVNALASTVPQADYVWRIILMVGALPAALTYYWRMKMPETARYTALVAKNAKQAATDMSKVLQVDLEAEEQKVEQFTDDKSNQFGLFTKKFLRRHGLHLLGTTSTWFLLDIAFYSQNLFQKDIFSAIGWIPKAETMNAIDEVYRIARAQTLIALCSTVPGYWFTVAFIDRIGRFAIQLMGFFFMTVFMFALAIPYDHWTHKDNRIGFVIIYSLTFFFANFGPNATTFVVPAEIFPARLRSTCHGISAASGKLGAIVGAFGFLYLAQNKDKTKTDAGYPPGIGVKNSLLVLGVVNFFGILFTFLVPESNGKSLEEMSGENENDEGSEPNVELVKRESKVVMAKELQVLNALDVAKTQWYHFTAIIIAGMGFFTDAYDLFCISLVTKLLGRIYYHVDGAEKPGSLPPNVAAAVNGVAFCGTLSGQLFFGWLGDKMGRKRVYGMTLMLMVICSIASGLSFSHDAKAVMSTLCFFRFWLGFGIGGDYPLSATIMSEYANKKTRGAFIAAVFAMQGFGILAGGIFAIIISSAFKASTSRCAYLLLEDEDAETARYTALVAKNAKQAATDMSKVLQVDLEAEEQKVEQFTDDKSNQFSLFTKKFLRRHGLHLLGTISTWFLLDIAFYSQILFQKDIFSAIGWIPKAETMNAIDEVYRIARAQTLIALCSTVPGYWFTVAFIDRIGRFAIQLMGFFFMTVFMFALAIPYDHWTHKDNRIGFVIIYSLTFFFANFGPNATTFVVPAEIFPARLRSTCHGISAASGKLGAIVCAFGFLYLAQSQDKAKADAGYPAGIGVKNSLLVLGVVNFFGILFTFLVPESNGKSLEEMSGENETDEGSVTNLEPSSQKKTVSLV